MEIVRDTPFEVATVPWQLAPPQWSLTVVVKATFTLSSDGSLSVADEQRPCGGDEGYDDLDPPTPKLESDLTVYKPRGEWFVVGHCYPPGGEATTSACSVTLGSTGRALAIFGDRYWNAASIATPPLPFRAMPLRWERSFGGPGHPVNPVGRGLVEVQSSEGLRRPLPNIEDPDSRVMSPEDRPVPAGFGPLAKTWPVRARFAGTYDAHWHKTRWPWFAEDLDTAFFLGSQFPQWADQFFRGDEPFELVNLHPEHGRLRGRLPSMLARVAVTLRGAGGAEGPLTEVNAPLDTVTFFPDTMEVVCSWRAVFPVADEEATNVGTLFVTHDALDGPRPLASLATRLTGLLAERAAEAGEDLSPPPPGAPATPAEIASAPAAVGAVAATLAARGVRAEAAPPSDAALATAPDGNVAVRDELEDRMGRDEPLTDMDLTGMSFRGLSLVGRTLTGLLAANADFTGVDLSGADLTDAVLSGANFDGANLRGATLTRAELTGAHGTGARFDGATLTDAVVAEGRFLQSSWLGAILDGVDFSATDLTGSVLRDARGKRTDFTAARLDRCLCERATFPDALFRRASVVGARFEDATLTGLRALDGSIFDDASFRAAKLEGANFSESQLARSRFAFATLTKADFTAATMPGAGFEGCHLRGACFDRAKLPGSTLIRCDLFEARFESADLTGVDLRGSNLHGAEFWRAKVEGLSIDLAIVTKSSLDPNL